MDQPASPMAPQQGFESILANRINDMSVSQPASKTCTCGTGNCTCGARTNSDNNVLFSVPPYVYALGKIEPRFPSLAIEKEFAQVTARAETIDLTDQQVLKEILSNKQNRYLVRQLCWVFTIEGIETYLLIPQEPTDLDLLVESLRATDHPGDIDIIVGIRGQARRCNDLMLPTVLFDQLYTFDLDTFIKSIPRPEKTKVENFEAAANGLFLRVMRLANNVGELDEHRALNYLSLRYPAIYAMTAEAYSRNLSFSGFQFRYSGRSSTRKIIEVIFSYINRQTDMTEKYFVRVDVTEEFPFLVTKPAPFYEA